MQIHPCYVIKILKSNFLSFEDQKTLISTIFDASKSSQKNRLNYLLLSVFKEMLEFELQRFEKYEIPNLKKNEIDSVCPIQFG